MYTGYKFWSFLFWITVIIAIVIAIFAIVLGASAAIDYITFEWRQDSILMRWDGPANAARYYGSLCIQKIKPFSNTTSCIWDMNGRYTTQRNVWFIIPYQFTVGTYKITSGTVAAYDAAGHVIASQTFTSSATWKYYDKDYLPLIRKSNPYP